MDRASLLTQTKDKNIIDVEINKDLFVIRAASVEMGKVEEKMNIENETNNSLKISFSAKYMLEALKMFNKEYIYILLNGEISPIILKDVDGFLVGENSTKSIFNNIIESAQLKKCN